MNWLILVFLSAISGAVARILQKVLLKEKDSDVFAFGFVFQLMGAVLVLIYTLATNTLEIPNLSGVAFNIILMILLFSVANIFTFKAFKLAEASEVTIIFASNTAWAVLSAVLILGDQLNAFKLIGIAMVILGIVVINYTKSKWKLNKGHMFALIGAILFGIAFTNDIFVLNRFNSAASYMILTFSLPALATLFFKPSLIKNVPYYLNGKILIKLLLCSVFFTSAVLAIFEAYKSGGQASIISPISQISIIFTVIISYIFLKERDRMLNKTIGAVLTIGGILLLV